MNLRLGLALTVIAPVVLVAGCGGSDEASSTSGSSAGEPLSRAEFNQQADGACKHLRKNMQQEMEAFSKKYEDLPETIKFVRTFKAIFIPVVEAEISAIRELAARARDRAKIETMLVATQRGLDSAKKTKRADNLVDFSEHFSTADRMLRDYGLKLCPKS